MDARRKILLAVVLFLVWAGLAVWQWRAWEEPVRVPLTNVTGSASSARQTTTRGSGLHVNLERLVSAHIDRETTFTAPRNIFALPSLDGAFPIGAEMGEHVIHQDASSRDAALQQVVSAELAQYKYLGFLRLGEGRTRSQEIAVLSKNEEVMVGKVGDRVEDHLVLKAITPESVTIRDTGTSIDQTVPLSEEPPPQQ
ncbi:MAG: hypothetical protein HP491_01410 [Nitrospira sp.]|nr:hypothetical protein [Nitrospira sp.]MBH0180629.1 hypothetical protein [Nitrospira sp.]MBH0185440.1 hypothetical protein [Nitrospira sp.]